jgi:hypothetical protein
LCAHFTCLPRICSCAGVPSKPLPAPFAACLAASGAAPRSPAARRQKRGGLGVGPTATALLRAPAATSSSSSSQAAPLALFSWLLALASEVIPDLMLVPVGACIVAAAYLLSDLAMTGVRPGCGLSRPDLCFPPVTELWQEVLGVLAGAGFVYLLWPGRPPLWTEEDEDTAGRAAGSEGLLDAAASAAVGLPMDTGASETDVPKARRTTRAAASPSPKAPASSGRRRPSSRAGRT